MLKNKLNERLARALEIELPYAESLDEYLDTLIPIVRPWGEDLQESVFYEDTPWLELRDDDSFHETVLHFFNEGGEYLISVNGNVTGGSWRFLEKSNKMLLVMGEEGMGGQAELYELAFLNRNFFILAKHGNQRRLGMPKYFVLINERIGRNLEWREAMELLYNTYRSNNNVYVILALIILFIVALAVILSTR